MPPNSASSVQHRFRDAVLARQIRCLRNDLMLLQRANKIDVEKKEVAGHALLNHKVRRDKMDKRSKKIAECVLKSI